MECRVRGCRPQSSGSDRALPCTSNKASWHLMLLKTGGGAGGLLSRAWGPAGPFAFIKDWDGSGLAGSGWVEDCGGDWGGGGLVGDSAPGRDDSGRV